MNEEQNKSTGHERIDCVIVSIYFVPQMGGIEKFLARLAGALDKKISVAVLAPQLTGSEAVDGSFLFPVHRRALLGETLARHESWFKPLYPFLCASVFLQTLLVFRRYRPKMICSGSADCAWAIGLAARLLGLEFSFICHGKDVHVRPGLFAYFFKKLPLKLALRLSSVCFVNSRFTWSLIDPGMNCSKIRWLKVPIDTGLSGPPSEEAIEDARRIVFGEHEGSSTSDSRVILSVGRLRSRKGFQHMIGALANLEDSFSNIRYVIVGSGPFEGELRAEAEKHGVSDRVIFAGEHDPPDAFYALADIFITVTWDEPGEAEGFGMVFIEAGRFGVPSIAGDIGGMPEAVLDGKTGLCVRSGSPDSIADAIKKLLDDDEMRKAMGQAAKEYASEFFPALVAEQFIADCGLAHSKTKSEEPTEKRSRR